MNASKSLQGVSHDLEFELLRRACAAGTSEAALCGLHPEAPQALQALALAGRLERREQLFLLTPAGEARLDVLFALREYGNAALASRTLNLLEHIGQLGERQIASALNCTLDQVEHCVSFLAGARVLSTEWSVTGPRKTLYARYSLAG